MPKKFNDEILEVVGALDREDVAVKEIARRLNQDEAGFGYEVKISERSVYDYRAAYRKKNGPPPTNEIDQDRTAHSIEALKKRALERIAREIQAYEQIAPGKMTGDQASTMRRLFSTMDDMERREQIAEKRRGRSPASANGNGKGDDKPESAVERLAREAREKPGEA
jgi:hypothetical protein